MTMRDFYNQQASRQGAHLSKALDKRFSQALAPQSPISEPRISTLSRMDNAAFLRLKEELNARTRESTQADGAAGATSSLNTGNDYFDEGGNYLYTDCNPGNEVRIIYLIDYKELEELPSASKDAAILAKSRNVMHLRGSLDAAKVPMSRITSHYLKELGRPEVKADLKIDVLNVASTGLDLNKKGLRIAIAWNYFSINSIDIVDNKFNYLNTLVHELVHHDKHYVACLDDQGIPSFDHYSADEEKGGALRHLDAFWTQILHWTWGYCSLKFKTDRMKTVGSILTYLSQDNPTLAMSWKQKFEQTAGFRFGKLTNESITNEVSWK